MASPPRTFLEWGTEKTKAGANVSATPRRESLILASIAMLVAALICQVSYVGVSRHLTMLDKAGDSIRDFTAHLERVSRLDPELRRDEITYGPVAYIKFEQSLRPVDVAYASQLGSIWASVRREAVSGTLVDSDLNWILIKSRETISRLEKRSLAMIHVQSGLIVAGAIILVAAMLTMVVRLFRSHALSVREMPRGVEPPQTATHHGVADEWLSEAGRKRFESVFDRLPVACCSFESDGRVSAWNNAAEEVTGKFTADVLQTAIWDAVEWRQMPDVIKSTLAKLFKGESVEIVEWTYQHPNGERRQFSAKLLPYLSPAGKVTGGLIAIHDITLQREQERQLVESDETKAAILTALPDCLLRIDTYGRLLDLSHEPGLTEASLSQFLQSPRWVEALPTGLGELILGSAKECRQAHEPQSFEFHITDLNECHLLVRVVPCGMSQVLVILHDIADRYRAEMATKDSESRLRYMIQGSADILSVVTPEGEVTYQSPAVEAVCGVGSESMVGQSLATIVHPNDWAKLAKMLKALAKKPYGEAKHSCRLIHSSGESREVEILARNLLSNPHVNGIVLNTRDVTERRQLELELQRRIAESEAVNDRLEEHRRKLEGANEMLSRLATTDGLTGLHNHRAFQNQLADAMVRSTDKAKPLSVILLDVDKFKEFNDEYGHIRGDAVLIQVGQILQQACLKKGFAARYGGEEFVVILEPGDQDAALEFAEHLRAQIETAAWPDRKITASFGVSTLGQARLAQGSFIHEADRALYASKERGRNCVTHAFDLAEAA